MNTSPTPTISNEPPITETLSAQPLPKRQNWAVVGLILFFIVSGLWTVIYYFLKPSAIPESTNHSQNRQQTTIVPDTGQTAFTDQIVSTNPYEIIYLSDDNNVSVYDKETSTSTAITTDAKTLGDQRVVWYNVPTFIDAQTLAYQRCMRIDLAKSPNYDCDVIIHSLSNGTTKKIYSTNSTINESEYAYGGQVDYIVASPNKQQLAIIEDTHIISLVTIDQGTVQAIANYPEGLGRGGGYGDDIFLDFSPDGTKLLATITFLQPSVAGNSSIYVYDISPGQPTTVWKSLSEELWSFGRWVSNDTFVASKLAQSETDKNLVASITPQTNTVTYLIENDQAFFDLQPEGTTVYFWQPNGLNQKGTELKKLNTQTKEVSKVSENTPVIAQINNTLYTYVLADCNDECSMGNYYGYEPSDVAFVDLTTGIKTPIPNSATWRLPNFLTN